MEEKKNSSSSTRTFSPSSSFESLSTSDLEAAGGFSAPSTAFPFRKYPSYRRNMVGPGLRSCFFLDEDDGAHHFLDSCYLCKKPLGGGRDIYMYRGDTPFCSEECRQEQIEMDESSETRLKLSQKQQQKSKSAPTPSKSEKIHLRVTGTVVAG